WNTRADAMPTHRILHLPMCARLLLINWRRPDLRRVRHAAARLLAVAGLALLACTASAQTHLVDDELRDLLKNHIEDADSFSDRFDAEAWLMLMSGRLARYVEDPDQRLHLLRLIHREANAAGVKPEL